LQTLCRTSDVERVVFLTSVPGIYDKPPDSSKGSHFINLSYRCSPLLYLFPRRSFY